MFCSRLFSLAATANSQPYSESRAPISPAYTVAAIGICAFGGGRCCPETGGTAWALHPLRGSTLQAGPPAGRLPTCCFINTLESLTTVNRMPTKDGCLGEPMDRRFQLARTLRVLHVTGSLRRGGVETWLRNATVRLPRERYQCDFCTYVFSGGAYAADLERYGCALHFVPRGSSPLALCRFSRGFRRLLREGHYDVVHCHGLLLVGFLLLLARSEGVPVRIGHSHNTDRKTGGVLAMAINRFGLALNRPLARAFSTHGLGCSAEAAAALFGEHWRDKSRYSIIHCGIDLDRFEAEAVRAPWRETLGISRVPR